MLNKAFHSRGQQPYYFVGIKESTTPTGSVWDNMAAVSLFWDGIMAAVTSCGNALQLFNRATVIHRDCSYLASRFCNSYMFKVRSENFPEEYQDM